MKINRAWSMPNKQTFSISPIRELIKSVYSDIPYGSTIVDPFANNGGIKTLFNDCEMLYGEILKSSQDTFITNDLDEQYDTTYHMDATDFLKQLEDNSVDLLLYDPPYSPRQVSESYKKLGKSVNMQTTQASYWSSQKKEISRIVKPNGRVITFGWNSGGIGKTNGFEIYEILMVAHGGWHNDTICTVEVKL